MRTALALALVVSLAACQPGEAIGPQPDTFFVLKDSSVTHPRFRIPAGGAERVEAQEEARRQFLEGGVAASRAISEALRSSEDWESADRSLRAFLSDAHPEATVQSRREMIVASGFLPGHLVNANGVTKAKQEAIAYYVTLLIENRSPKGVEHLGPALDQLEGHWPEVKLAEARKMVAAAQRRAQSRQSTTA